MLPLGNEFVAFAAPPVCHAGLGYVKEKFGCGKQLFLGPNDALLAIEIHERHAMIAKCLPLHGEVASWRGEQPKRIPKLAERVGVISGRCNDLLAEELCDVLLESHNRPYE